MKLEIRTYKLHKAIEYIKHQQDFPFDATDVEERLEEVLDHFCVKEFFSSEEEAILIKDLLPLGIAAELAEIIRQADKDDDSLIMSYEYRMSGYKKITPESVSTLMGCF